MNTLSRKTIFILTVRTFFIRLFYNYHNLFGEGVCYCLMPFKENDNTEESRKCLLKKHMKFFNTNEYMSGFALGIILNLDEKMEEHDSDKTKSALSSSAGSIGDQLIYKIILPVMVLIPLNKFVISGFTPDNCTVIIVLSELFIFNIFNFSIRYFGIKKGYELGMDSLKVFKSISYRRILFLLTVFKNILIASLIVNLFLIY